MNNEVSFGGVGRSWLYALFGFFLGILAPSGWIVLRLILFWQPGETLWSQIFGDVVRSSENMLLYAYMGGGTALVLCVVGFLIGKGAEQIHQRARNLDELNQAIAQQKESYESRFIDLNNGIKNFHAINNHIQKSIDFREVLRLAANGLHEILGYDRVNILMVNLERNCLEFVASRGCGNDDVSGISIPLDGRAGALFKAVNENRLLLVEDIGRMPEDYHLQPPCDDVHQLRSKSFILCPIVVRDEVVGVFGVDNKVKRKELDDTDVDTVKLFADQVASTLTKINLLEAVETLTKELEHTFEELLRNREEHSRYDLSLKQATASTSDATNDIASAADVVREAVDVTRSSVGEISVSIEEVSQNLNQLSGFMENSISAMTEISNTIKEVEENGIRSHGMSEKVKQQAEEGSRAVGDAMAGLHGISEAVDGAVAAIGRLSEKGEEVDSVTSVINEITQKTNLLALNAAIIAAQAGEHGRSFAVVADEVRSLSQEAANSTGAIAQIIQEIQQYTRETVEHIDQTRQLVQGGLVLGQGMEASLHQILDSSVLAMERTHEIRKATQEVARSVESVSESIENLGDMSSQVTVATREQAQGTRSIVQSVEEVKNMADDMVHATEKQQRNTREIELAVTAVSEMTRKIFSEMEERQKGSREVLENLERLKKGSSGAT
ncbi:MAG: chemotaxis protein [Desulfuromonas sp.]|uniref:methyl-accepting chemotaxis protein n=1 Tax=Desulfuromonas sp. TaxID=892 RepID=UPI000CC12AAA|nr:methyl-accepting chemotaxis protein [Desulfuromonas sp.]PLX85147.1 MAG: chemotaxis protein [Desulfuromonas sp.]